MKKLSYRILGGLLFLSAIASCKKEFLDETVYSRYAPSTLTDSLGFEASIAGLYNHFSYWYGYSGRQGWLSVWQVGTDIAYAGPGQQEGIEVPYFNYTQLVSTDAAASFTWSWCYRMINNANIIIKNVEDPALVGMGQINKDQTNAEARFFRAYAYNMLATCFGPVPLQKEPVTGPKTDYTRAPLTEVNALIEEDLLFAASKLPTVNTLKSNSKGKMYARATQARAKQLLAEAYLRMDKPAQAEQQAQSIISSGDYKLTTARYGVRASQPGDPFADMFIYGNERYGQGNKEAIWTMEMEHPATVLGGINDNPQLRRVWKAAYYQISGMIICDSLGGRGLARLRLNNFVAYNLYEDNDMRNSPYNFRRKFYYNDVTKPNYGQQIPNNNSDSIVRLCPHTTKWDQFDPNDAFGYATIKDVPVMRLGETYLLLAEAQVKQNKMTEAAATVNILRSARKASTVSAGQMSLDFILDERVRELVGEENRRMTLMRTKKLVERAVKYNSVSPGNQLSGISDKNLLMPIPQSEIDLNKDAKLEQNAGYQ